MAIGHRCAHMLERETFVEGDSNLLHGGMAPVRRDERGGVGVSARVRAITFAGVRTIVT